MARWDDEIMTDNTGNNRQCKTCAFWDGGNAYSNAYNKAFCQKYEYPKSMKPLGVIQNTAECRHYRREE